MANVDLHTGIITGAVKGSRTYYHEEGHLIFEKKYRYGNLVRSGQQLTPRFLLYSLGLWVLYPNIICKIFVVVFMLLSIFLEGLEESWCWGYANKKIATKEKREDAQAGSKDKDE